MKTLRLVALATLAAAMACEGFKEAMTAHVDVAARAASQSLSVQRLAELMGRSQVPLQKELAKSIADVWVNYQLLAKAAATNDSLADTTLIDNMMWPLYTRSRMNKWAGIVSQTWKIDTTNLDQKFSNGDLLAARHILFQVPTGQQATGSDSIRRKAESVLKQTTVANFAAMAKRYSSDVSNKDRGGDLGVFGRGKMVPEFDRAVAALKPGEIAPLVQTQFGYHIVKRNTYEESKDAFRSAYDSMSRSKMESTYVTNTEKAGKLQVKPNAPRVVKELLANPESHKDDRTAVATSVLGDYTAAQVVRWLLGSPQPEQTRAQLQQAPDSVIPEFVKFLVRNELLMRQADSAKVQLDPSEVQSIRQAFRMLLFNAWAGLQIAPPLLSDSAKTPAERERLATSRIDKYLDRLLQQQEQYIDVPTPLANALREKYEWKVNSAGLDRAVQAAQKIRATADSTRAAQQPKSAVPMPTPPTDTGVRDTGKKKG